LLSGRKEKYRKQNRKKNMVKKYRKSIFDQLESPPKNQKYIRFFEKIRWNGKVVSPYDFTSKV